MRLRGIFLLLAGLWSAGISHAQLFPFSLRAQQGDQVFTVANNANLSVGADAIGVPVTLKVTATYRGTTQATIPTGPELVGSPAFSLVSQPTFPVTLNPADALTFEIRFTPAASSTVTAQFGLVFVEAPAVGTQPSVGFITLNLAGAAPDLVVSYFFAADANVLALASGSQLLFPPTPVNTSATATISITNRGSATGTVNSINVTGAAFQPLGIPLLPGSLNAGQELRFAIRYSPKEIETVTGTVDISFAGDRKVSAGLEASSTGPRFVYEVLRGADVIPVLPNGSIPLSDAQVGETSNISVQVRNTGNGEGVIPSLGVSGQGFRITDSAFFPQTLKSDGVTIFTLEFAPTLPGQVRGRLRVGNDTFEITALAIGSRLAFSYGAGSAAVPVLPGGGVFFSPLQSGQTARVDFTAKNNGTAPATISSIGVVEPRSPFTVEGLPALPVTLAAGQTVGFAINFTPSSAGFTTGTLRLDGLSFTLSGSASAPPPLPAYRISGPSGNIDALQQPAVGLTLDAPYPFALTGILTLNPEPEGFFADPAVQFATGGRAVSFTIPANSTEATFANGSRQIRLQTGTVAGAITLTPSFSIAGPVDVTPSSPATLRMTVVATAPRLLGAQLSSRTATGVVILITGYTTTRSLTQLDFEFSPVPGFNLPTTRLSVNISGASQLWFGGSQSQGFGGQFTVSIPFNLRADLTATPADGLLRVSITASNERGASNAVQAELQ